MHRNYFKSLPKKPLLQSPSTTSTLNSPFYSNLATTYWLSSWVVSPD